LTPLTPAEQQLVETHYDLLCRVARKRSPDWWRDARQIGFIGLVKGIRSFCPDGGMPLEKWLARHIDFEIRRAIDRGKAPLATPELAFDVAAPHGEDIVELRDEIVAMRAKIDTLPEPIRKAVLAHLAEADQGRAGGEQARAARKLGWPLWRMRDTIERAQRLLAADAV